MAPPSTEPWAPLNIGCEFEFEFASQGDPHSTPLRFSDVPTSSCTFPSSHSDSELAKSQRLQVNGERMDCAALMEDLRLVFEISKSDHPWKSLNQQECHTRNNSISLQEIVDASSSCYDSDRDTRLDVSTAFSEPIDWTPPQLQLPTLSSAVGQKTLVDEASGNTSPQIDSNPNDTTAPSQLKTSEAPVVVAAIAPGPEQVRSEDAQPIHGTLDPAVRTLDPAATVLAPLAATTQPGMLSAAPIASIATAPFTGSAMSLKLVPQMVQDSEIQATPAGSPNPVMPRTLDPGFGSVSLLLTSPGHSLLPQALGSSSPVKSPNGPALHPKPLINAHTPSTSPLQLSKTSLSLNDATVPASAARPDALVLDSSDVHQNQPESQQSNMSWGTLFPVDQESMLAPELTLFCPSFESGIESSGPSTPTSVVTTDSGSSTPHKRTAGRLASVLFRKRRMLSNPSPRSMPQTPPAQQSVKQAQTPMQYTPQQTPAKQTPAHQTSQPAMAHTLAPSRRQDSLQPRLKVQPESDLQVDSVPPMPMIPPLSIKSPGTLSTSPSTHPCTLHTQPLPSGSGASPPAPTPSTADGSAVSLGFDNDEGTGLGGDASGLGGSQGVSHKGVSHGGPSHTNLPHGNRPHRGCDHGESGGVSVGLDGSNSSYVNGRYGSVPTVPVIPSDPASPPSTPCAMDIPSSPVQITSKTEPWIVYTTDLEPDNTSSSKPRKKKHLICLQRLRF